MSTTAVVSTSHGKVSSPWLVSMLSTTVKAKKIQVATATEDVSCPSVGMLNMVPGLMVDLNPTPGSRPVRC